MNLARQFSNAFVLAAAIALVLGACGEADPQGTGPVTDDIVDDAGVDPDLDPANGLPLGAGPYAIATLVIEINHPDFDTVSYELACFGDTATLAGGNAPDVSAPAACTALADPLIEDYLVDGPPSDQMCTEIYGGPDTATLIGRVNDRPVELTVDRTNGCGIDAWDNMLADVLPPARGAL